MKSVTVFGQNRAEIASSIDEKRDAIELVASMEVVQKPPRRLFRCRRKQAHVRHFVRLGIDRAAQPGVLAVQADRFLVDRKLIRSDRRGRL